MSYNEEWEGLQRGSCIIGDQQICVADSKVPIAQWNNGEWQFGTGVLITREILNDAEELIELTKHEHEATVILANLSKNNKQS